MMPTPRIAAAACRNVVCTSLLAAGLIALTACSAVENREANSPETSGTRASATPLRTEALTPAPNPPPSNERIPPVGDVSLAIDDRGDLGEIIVDSTGRTLYVFSTDAANGPTCYDDCADT